MNPSLSLSLSLEPTRIKSKSKLSRAIYLSHSNLFFFSLSFLNHPRRSFFSQKSILINALFVCCIIFLTRPSLSLIALLSFAALRACCKYLLCLFSSRPRPRLAVARSMHLVF